VNIYQCKNGKLPGSSFDEILPLAREVYRGIAKKTKRTPYVRSAYFDGEKIFLNVFWAHMNQKNRRDRARRLKFYECAIELIKNSRIKPEIKKKVGDGENSYYRFIGEASDGGVFYVQVKQDKKGGKHLMSIVAVE
jgi:hypothetical protein